MRIEKLAGLTVRIAGGVDRNGSGDGPLVVLLHGYGAPGTDLVGLWREVNVGEHVRFAFPEAPIVLTPGMSEPGRAWWPLDMLRLQQAVMTSDYDTMAEHIPQGMLEARVQLSEHLAALSETLQVPPNGLILGGFSQGAMLSCELAFSTDIKLGGLAVLSGTLINRHAWLERLPLRKGLPVLQSHGRSDPILPFALAERLHAAMQTAELAVRFIPFNGGHGLSGNVLLGLEGFLLETLVRPSTPSP